MGVITLPTLKVPSQMPSSSSQRIYLAFILRQYQPGSPVVFSQRGGRKLFNRGAGRLVSSDLKELSRSGWLISRQFEESEALAYSPGRRVTAKRGLNTEWQSFSTSLFGDGGLIKRFINSPIWGHGLFGFNQALVLGAVVHRKQNIRRVDIINYLSGLVGISSIDTALRKLVEAKIVVKSDGYYLRCDDWKTNLQILIDSHVGGTARKKRIAREVRIERRKYANLVRAGELTPIQRKQLLKKPCVRCGAKAKQVEHYPPVKYGGRDHSHLVWAICKTHNDETKAFIKKLGPQPLLTSSRLVIKKGIDPNHFLRASLTNSLRNFYLAADKKDYTKGLEIVRKSCQLIFLMEQNGLLRTKAKRGQSRRCGKRTIKGRHLIVRESSRLPYSPHH